MKKLLCLATLALYGFAPLAWSETAKDFPSRPIKIVVMTTPGSSADQSTRILCEQLQHLLGAQPCIVDNRAGGDGAIGASYVKDAPADGYTILMGSNSPLAVNPVVKKGLPYDPLKDFKPVFGSLKSMNVLVVAGDSKFNTLAEFVQAARNDGRPMNVGSSFAGYRLDMEWFSTMAKVKFNHIPYKGTAQVLADVVGHQLDAGYTDRAVAGALLQAGKLKGLAVGGETRYRDPPEIPTMIESGYPEFISFAWTGLFVPARTPDDIVAKLADAAQKAMASAPMQDLLKRLGADALPLGPAAMRKFHEAEIARYQRAADAAGIKPE